jgi:hypothetical protein
MTTPVISTSRLFPGNTIISSFLQMGDGPSCPFAVLPPCFRKGRSAVALRERAFQGQ